MGSESYKQAMRVIADRRQNAQRENARRTREIGRVSPLAARLMEGLQQTGSAIVRAVSEGPERSRTLIEEVMRENLAAQRQLSQLLKEAGYPGDYLEPPYTCPLCGDTGYVEGKKCRCLKELMVKYSIRSFSETAHVPAASFQDFSLRYYSEIPEGGKSPRETMGAIFEFCRTYAQTFSTRSPSVLMMGETGLGKTHLSLAIAGEVMERGYSALYISAPDLFRKLQNEYYGRGEIGVDTMQLLLDADLTIIDDLGAEVENQFAVSALYNIINSRLNSGRAVIISTNLFPKELDRRYTNRVASRLMTMYKCLRFVGRDVRQIKLRNHEL